MTDEEKLKEEEKILDQLAIEYVQDGLARSLDVPIETFRPSSKGSK